MKSLNDKFPLIGGGGLPCVGFGTYLARDKECYDAVREALKVGYRHIDTAAFYGNEKIVGDAIKDSGINRKDVFVTTKVWVTDQGYDKTMRAFEKSFRELDIGYLDLYLIHWPIPTGHAHDYEQLNDGSWKAMTLMVEQGALKYAGVSNFLPCHIESLIKNSDYRPVVNQIECHPALNQDETVEYCLKNGIIVEAWRPLMHGNADEYPVLTKIAERHGCTASQVCLAWLLERGICPIPKSVTPSRIRENADVFEIKLTPEEMREINAMPEHRFGSHPLTFNK